VRVEAHGEIVLRFCLITVESPHARAVRRTP
jgi:hypothetical protein